MRSSIMPGLAALVASVALTGCLTEVRYVTSEEGGPITFALTEDTPPFLQSEDATVFLVEERILFEFDAPTDAQLAELQTIEPAIQIPYATMPFLRRGDIEVQVDFVLSNLSDNATTVAVVLNGINEFHEYNPQITIVDDELVIDFSGWERTVRVEAGERFRWTVRQEQLDEIAVDLATVVNGERAPDRTLNANQIVFFQNQSGVDERSQFFIPDVIPALTGLRVGLRSTSAVPLVLEVAVRVRDERGVLWGGNPERLWELPEPVLFAPADAVAAPATP